MEPVLRAKGCTISATQLYADASLPALDSLDWLIVLGGPMGVADEADYPWLSVEKKFIKAAIDANKVVLGVCLGAQLIAEVLGAKVSKNPHREIGWFSIKRDSALLGTRFASVFPEQFEAFHWHGDTFDVPANAVAIGASEACQHQGFVVGDRIVALQFHLETTPQSAAELIDHGGDELDSSQYVQTAQQMLSHTEGFSGLRPILMALLEAFEQKLES